jgi:hypothetical protein
MCDNATGAFFTETLRGALQPLQLERMLGALQSSSKNEEPMGELVQEVFSDTCSNGFNTFSLIEKLR